MNNQLLKLFRDKSQQEVTRDYFIHYVMQHESCLAVENSKKYVLVPSWLAMNEQTDSYHQSLQAMTDWYWQNFSIIAEDKALTFDNLYGYVPVFLTYLDEARRLWQEFHTDAELPAYREDAEFWCDLVSILKQRSKHQHLIMPYLQWRYGSRTIKSFPQHNHPPNPFTEERFFKPRRDSYRPTDKATNNRSTDRQRPPMKPRGNREDHRRRPTSNQRDGLSAEMTAEIKSAVALLQDDSTKKEVTLRPANSYYRRLQHQAVANLGFGSRSINKGNNERAVRVVRNVRGKKRQ